MPVQRICATCSTIFHIKPSKISKGRGIYCSWACMEIGRGFHAPLAERTCVVCSSSFSIYPSQVSKRPALYCGKECRAVAEGWNGTPEERFWRNVDTQTTPDGCWPWVGDTGDKDGYGRLSIHGKKVRAHRFAYELAHGPLPPNIFICHTCDNPPCCREDHLFPGDGTLNAADMVSKGRSLKGSRHWSIMHPDIVPRGERSGTSKLTEQDIIAIRSLSGTITQLVLAERYGVSFGTISKIIRRTRWQHIP